jgi:hypothetical protein
MKQNLEQLKQNFVIIKDIRNKVTTVFQILETHLTKLKQTYSEFVLNNKQHLFVFGLDSFQFQSKIIDIEYGDMKRLFLAINNRMYCEYYKLYKIISDYVKNNISDRKISDIIKVTNVFPVYKDLEPYKQYDFETIQDIHENIILLLYGIDEFIVNKENELQIYQKKQLAGLNINNFVTTFNYNILMFKEKGLLFISYIEFFHTLHTKYLQRFAMKMNLLYSQVTHDIRFDDAPKTPETKKNDLIHNFQNDHIDNSLIKQLRSSFDDSESNSNEYNSPNSSSNNEIELSLNNVYSKNINNVEIPNHTSIQSKLKNIFPKNITKMVSKIFKKNSTHLNTNISSVSSDSVSNIVIKEESNNNVLNNVLNKVITENIMINIDENSIIQEEHLPLINPITMEDEEELLNTLSQDHMFLEITNQCNEITFNFEKVRNICSEENMSASCFIEDDHLIEEKVDYLVEEKVDYLVEEKVDYLVEEKVDYLVEEKVDYLVEEKVDYLVEEKVDYLVDDINVKVDVDVDDNMSVITIENVIVKTSEDIPKKKQYKPRKKKPV